MTDDKNTSSTIDPDERRKEILEALRKEGYSHEHINDMEPDEFLDILTETMAKRPEDFEID